MKRRSPDRFSRFRTSGFLLAVAVLFFSSAASYADTGILDNIATSYKTAAGGWATTLLTFANRLFMLLATIELAWSFIVWALEKNEYQSFVAAIAKKIMWIGIFYALLLNGPVWIPTIIDSFTQAGTAASGVPGLSPSEVFTAGLDNAATMLEGIKTLSLWDDMLTIILAGISAIAIVIAFAVISGQLLVALVESYIAISAGLLFLGFGGSRWTTDFVQKFIGYAVATGVKLFMLYLIIGIGTAQALTWKTMLSTIGTPGAEVFNIILTVLGGSILLSFLAWQIPGMAASMLAGSPTLTAGGAAATAGMMGAAVVGAGAAGAASTMSAAKSMGGLASAAGAAYKEAGAQGATGLGRAVATLGNMGTAAARDSGNRMSDAIAPTKGGRMADISTARTAEMVAANTPAAPPTPPAPPMPPAPEAAPAAPAEQAAAPTSADSSTAAAPASAETAASSVASPATATPGAAPAPAATPAAPPATAAAPAAPATAPAAVAGSTPTPTPSDSGNNAAATAAAAAGGIVGETPANGDFASLVESGSKQAANATTAPAATPVTASSAGSEAATATAATPTAESVTAAPEATSGATGSATAATTEAAGTAADIATGTAASPAAHTPQGVQEKAPAQARQAPGMEDRFRDLQQVRPPQLPPDAAPAATVHIKFDAQHD